MVKGAKKIEDRDQQILSRLAHIEHKVESIDDTNAFALRADADKHTETVKKIFQRGKRRAQVYLAADGTRGVVEIARHLGMKTPNVSPQLRILKEEGLLELVDAPGRQDFWAKKSIDRTLRISKYLCDAYNLKLDGRSEPGRKKKRK
ncbi:MAG TPA: winged helix-turn-helix domain-containing protein [Candidatus Acidoferrales bacterium]|jgi:DNA-binding transcriptional ArsR family regulator